MRGEHCDYAVTHSINRGSSPHARGALHARTERQVNLGIIPACAGSTNVTESFRYRPGDHPRMRGEHAYFSRSTWVVMGSSPHARGALVVRNLELALDGIIPACAGST